MNEEHKTHIIVISTKENPFLNAVIAANLSVELLADGINTGLVDMSGATSPLSAFMEKRKFFGDTEKINLKTPKFISINQDISLDSCLKNAAKDFEAIVISSPSGQNDFKSAFFYADTLITILDDKTSLSLLSEPEPSKKTLLKPSVYTGFVWEIKKHLAAVEQKSLNWAILQYQPDETAQKQHRILEELAKLYGFRVAPHITPRDAFSERFLQGITFFDLQEKALAKKMTFSDLGAKRDCRKFAEFVLNSR